MPLYYKKINQIDISRECKSILFVKYQAIGRLNKNIKKLIAIVLPNFVVVFDVMD